MTPNRSTRAFPLVSDAFAPFSVWTWCVSSIIAFASRFCLALSVASIMLSPSLMSPRHEKGDVCSFHSAPPPQPSLPRAMLVTHTPPVPTDGTISRLYVCFCLSIIQINNVVAETVACTRRARGWSTCLTPCPPYGSDAPRSSGAGSAVRVLIHAWQA